MSYLYKYLFREYIFKNPEENYYKISESDRSFERFTCTKKLFFYQNPGRVLPISSYLLRPIYPSGTLSENNN
jgi:hypothetical protein